MFKKIALLLILNIFYILSFAQRLSLAGNWDVKLDSTHVGKANEWFKGFTGQKITLPGTLDDAKIGKTGNLDTANVNKAVLLSLTRKHRYIGDAWYSKQIVIKDNVDQAELFLERVIWKTECWIDGKYVGSLESLSAAQKFFLGNLKAGKHIVVLKIDNRKQYDISFNDFAHAYTDGTQIMWNGVIGKIELQGIRDNTISQIQIYPNAKDKIVAVSLSVNDEQRAQNLGIKYEIFQGQRLIMTKEFVNQKINNGLLQNEIQLKEVKLWDEFSPNVYTLKVTISGSNIGLRAKAQSTFGFRKLGNEKGALTLNGNRIFLRGTLDCNVYPVQGHPPMEKAEWKRVFGVIKDYGLNHIRYHSWCPPEAAFQVADSLGLYLQIELPLWSLKVGEDKATTDFLEKESQQIIANYGNHPSFCFWSLGNELEGNFDWLNNLVAKLKKQDSRRFYTATTFSFQKNHGKAPEPNDDIFITQYTEKGWVRGQGVFNAEAPRFDLDYQKSAEGLGVPLIAHEVGQYSIYPNLKEINKYTGVLAPLNFNTIRNDLKKKNLIKLADSFKLASGKFAALLYKEEIERALKTKAFSGFQLLDLHDFPGQGTALVGLLDAFWESKGLITPQEFRQFSSAVVPLLNYKSSSYLNSQVFNAQLQVANFRSKKFVGKAKWRISDPSGKILFSGKSNSQQIKLGTSILGEVSIPLNTVAHATQLTFFMEIEDTSYKNSWNFWVYPEIIPAESKSILITSSKNEAYEALKLGKTVILNPDTSAIAGIPGRFTTVFWSPVHFPDQPGSMGILCNPEHPALSNFPTTFFSNWQWWDLITSSKSLMLDRLDHSPQPIIRVIDNFYKNRNLGTVIEAKVGQGKLLLCTIDISNNLSERIEARQFRSSLAKYVASNNFSPNTELTISDVEKLLGK